MMKHDPYARMMHGEQAQLLADAERSRTIQAIREERARHAAAELPRHERTHWFQWLARLVRRSVPAV